MRIVLIFGFSIRRRVGWNVTIRAFSYSVSVQLLCCPSNVSSRSFYVPVALIHPDPFLQLVLRRSLFSMFNRWRCRKHPPRGRNRRETCLRSATRRRHCPVFWNNHRKSHAPKRLLPYLERKPRRSAVLPKGGLPRRQRYRQILHIWLHRAMREIACISVASELSHVGSSTAKIAERMVT